MTRRNTLLPVLSYAAAASLAIVSASCHLATQAERDAEPIVEKNVAARGGLTAWRAVDAMQMKGSVDAGKPRDPVKLAMTYSRPESEMRAAARHAIAHGGAEKQQSVQLPFVMEMQRPRKTRLEIRFQGQTAVQVYDGQKGWKLRPFLGRREVEPYTAEETRLAAAQADLDGLLIDSAAKGNRVELMGTEKVEGRDAYKLQVTEKDGQIRHVWVDTETSLDVRVDGTRRLDGKLRSVFTTQRDFKSVDGLMIPHTLETTVEGIPGSEKIAIDSVVLNPKLDGDRFDKPEADVD